MTTNNPKYTIKRDNTYWLQIRVPKSIFNQSPLDSPLIRRTLNTQDLAKAAALSRIVAFKVKELCQTEQPESLTNIKINKLISTTLISLGDKSATITTGIKNKIKRHSIIHNFNLYYKERIQAGRWRMKAQGENTASVNVFIELMGEIDVKTITTDTCRRYKEKLMKYPVMRTKDPKLKGKTIKAIQNGTLQYNVITITTVNNHIRKVSAFFNWLISQGMMTHNPLSTMKIKQTKSIKAARMPFEREELKLLFSTNIFTGHQFSADYKYWLPLIALYSGARMEELCQLHLTDFHFEGDIPYFRVDDSFPWQNLKNNSSRRNVPIHPELEQLGFIKYVQSKISAGEIRLFGDLIPQREKLGHQPSKWFSKYKRSLGLNDSRKVFHSFRHTMVENLRLIRAQDYEIKSLLGHQTGSITHDVYGSTDAPLKAEYEMLKALDFKEELTQVKAYPL